MSRARLHPVTGKPGWWDADGRAGQNRSIRRATSSSAPTCWAACMGSSGPATINPATGKPWAMAFPVITIRDMVRAQAMLLDHLGVEHAGAVVGGSMGGMQVLSWAATYPERVRAAVVIASRAPFGAEHRVPRSRAPGDHGRSEMARRRLLRDRRSARGGLAVARMAAHITYLSEAGLTEKFGRRLQAREAKTFGFDADFQVESYLRHQGSASSTGSTPIPISTSRARWIISIWPKSMAGCSPMPSRAAARASASVSFDTDWLYPTGESRIIVHALNAAGAAVSFVELKSPSATTPSCSIARAEPGGRWLPARGRSMSDIIRLRRGRCWISTGSMAG
jgi:homoserine O-acetyltransferase